MEEEIKKQSEFVLKLTEMKNAGLAIDESRIQVEETTKHLRVKQIDRSKKKKKKRTERPGF